MNHHTLKLLFTPHPYFPHDAHPHFLPLRLPPSPFTFPPCAPLKTQELSAYKCKMEIPLYFWFSNLFFPHEAISCFIWFLDSSQLRNFSVDSPDSTALVKEREKVWHLTLCNPRDCSPPGSSAPGILQERILSFLNPRKPPFSGSNTLVQIYVLQSPQHQTLDKQGQLCLEPNEMIQT